MDWPATGRNFGLALAASLILSGCAGVTAPGRGAGAGAADARGAAEGAPEALALGFSDVPAPQVYARELLGRRDRPKGAQGLWATVPGLRRAESAEVVNLGTEASVKVALFPGQVPAGEARLSNAAAELLGIGATPARVRITAVRREPVLVRE